MVWCSKEITQKNTKRNHEKIVLSYFIVVRYNYCCVLLCNNHTSIEFAVRFSSLTSAHYGAGDDKIFDIRK